MLLATQGVRSCCDGNSTGLGTDSGQRAIREVGADGVNVAEYQPVYVFRGLHSDGAVATRCVVVHDADTIGVHLTLPVWHIADAWLRIRGQWSPELHQPGGREARDYAASLILGQPVWVRTYKRPSDDEESRSFIRLIADVGFGPDADGTLRDFAGEMIAAGHASASRP